MLLSRILGGVGRFCIGLGALTLLFVTYQLWGTGILTAQAQNSLENDFEILLEEAGDVDAAVATIVAAEEPATKPPVADDENPENDDADPAPTEAIDEEAAKLAAKELELLSKLIWQENGEPIAQLIIPDINLEWTVVEGVGTDELRDGPGHYGTTPMPGMPGNTSIAGHRTTWGAPFNRIDELEPGDEITVRTIQGTFTYRVVAQESGKGHFIVTPDRIDVLDQDFEVAPNRLTLTACHPKFSARQRIIVVAELVGEPALFVPRPEELGPTSGSLASEDVADQPADADDDGLPGDPDLDGGTDTESESEAPGDESDEIVDDDAAGDETNAEEGTTVTASESSPPRPTSLLTTSDSFGEGLNGNNDAILPAIMWGVAAAFIAGLAGFVARRWKKLPSYGLALVPFALVLFVCFVHIDQALPSY